jgi:hypothetical protein
MWLVEDTARAVQLPLPTTLGAGGVVVVGGVVVEVVDGELPPLQPQKYSRTAK